MRWPRASVIAIGALCASAVAFAEPAPTERAPWLPPEPPREPAPAPDASRDAKPVDRKAWWIPARAQKRLWDRGPFSAHVQPDGRVAFTDHPVREVEAGADGALNPASFGAYDPTNAVERAPNPRILATFGFKFDIGDAVMRMHGEDPYRIQKQRFLARTFETRFAMALVARRRALLRALDELPADLQRIWSDRKSTAATKRATLATLWCEADIATKGHDERTGGDEARAIIADFVRRTIPKDSPERFTDDELAALETHCHARFRPYDAPSPTGP